MATEIKKPLYQGKKVTFDEYQNLKYDGFQYEIIKGVMKVTPAPFPKHQRLITYLSAEIEFYLRKNPKGLVIVSPLDVKLTQDISYQPDIIYISKENLHIYQKKYINGSPDFLIEVLSKGTLRYDLGDKFNDYEKYGVKEYWIIDPNELEVSEFYHLKDGKYEQFESENNVVKSKVIEGFEVDLTELEKSLNPFGLMNN